jgi:AbrB family looped-hinge helix DNA binding protein
MTLTRVRAKGQITIPDDIRRAARIQEGDYVELSVQGDAIVLRPKVLVSKAQAWFWRPGWQAGELEASEDIAAGRTTGYDSDEAFLESLG